MRSASETIDGTYRGMQAKSEQLIGMLTMLSNSVKSSETSQTLRRLGESLKSSDTAIHGRLQEAARLLGDSATGIEQVLRQSQADIESAEAEVRATEGGGRYGSALGG